MEEITLKVDGMTCGGCVRGVEKAVSGLAEVAEVKVDLKAGTARVRGTTLDAVKLVAAVQGAGYNAHVTEAPEGRPGYIPALRFHSLTRMFDPVLKWTMRDEGFKTRLLDQAGIGPGMRALDLGCGTGTLAVLAAQRGAEVTGIDADATALGLARAKAGSLPVTFMPGGILFYVSDGAQKPLAIEGFTGTAVVKGPGGIETVTLAPMGDHLHATAKLAQGEAATAVLTLTLGGKAESVSFESKAVGLQEHDHTSLHGGQVGMWGDYHLEYAPKDGEHRVWVTDATRAQVTGVTGSLKDGDTVVPLAFDPAAGLLSGKNEGAGTRPVMVDVKVGETSFSLAFNPAAGETPAASGHDHAGHGH